MRDSGSDVIQALGGVALDAAGIGPVTALWDSFFPTGEPLFIDAQLDQISATFQAAFDAASFEQNKTDFETLASLLNEYIDNKTPGQLNTVLNDALTLANRFAAHRPKTASVYITALSLHILALKLMLEQAPDSAGAKTNIAAAALDGLDRLADLEAQYQPTVDIVSFVNSKNATLDGGPLAADATACFGASYRDAVLYLIYLVQSYDPSRLPDVPHPAIQIQFLDYHLSVVQPFWSSWDGVPNFLKDSQCYTFFKCAKRGDYSPVGDVVTLSQGKFVGAPGAIPYIKALDGTSAIAPSGYAAVLYRRAHELTCFVAFGGFSGRSGVPGVPGARPSAATHSEMPPKATLRAGLPPPWTASRSGHGQKAAPVALLVHNEGRSGETGQFRGSPV